MAEMTSEISMKPSMQNEYKDKQQQTIVDLNNRDINHLNDILKDVVSFNDIIGEPEPNIYSLDTAWVASYHTYTVTKYWCYKILTVLFAVPCAIWWALTFACCSFCRIWCCVPWLKCLQVQCFSCGQIWQLYIQTFLHPVVDAFSRCCSRIKVGVATDIMKSEKFADCHVA